MPDPIVLGRQHIAGDRSLAEALLTRIDQLPLAQENTAAQRLRSEKITYVFDVIGFDYVTLYAAGCTGAEAAEVLAALALLDRRFLPTTELESGIKTICRSALTKPEPWHYLISICKPER